MKTIVLLFLFCVKLITSKVQLMTSESQSSLTYMTLVEGSNDIYEICKLICGINDMKTFYSETTVYPNYGKLFRCQCNEDFTPWYNVNTLAEVTMDLLKGDAMFNYYMNMPGNYQNECQCDNLKSLLYNILEIGRASCRERV